MIKNQQNSTIKTCYFSLIVLFFTLLLSAPAFSVTSVQESFTQAIDLQLQGQHKKVIDLLLPLLGDIDELDESDLDAYQLAQATGLMGLSHIYLGNPAEAEEFLDLSIAIADSEKLFEIKARSIMNKTNLTLAKGEIERVNVSVIAKEGTVRSGGVRSSSNNKRAGEQQYRLTMAAAVNDYEQGADAAIAAELYGLAARSYTYGARVSVELSNIDKAKELLGSAIAVIQKIENGKEKAFLIIGAADVLLNLSFLQDAIPEKDTLALHQLLNQATTISQNNNSPSIEAYSLGFLAQLYIKTAQYDEALTLTRRAIMVSELAGRRDLSFEWYAQIGEIATRQGNYQVARESYEKSSDIIDDVRDSLPQYDPISGRSLFRESVGPIYMAYADLLLKIAANNKDNQQDHLEKVRSLVESLKTAEVAQYFKDDCISNMLAANAPLDKKLTDTVILYPIIMNERLELIVSTPSGLQRYTSKVSSALLRQTAMAYRQNLLDPSSDAYRKPAEQLYNWLIRPFESTLDDDSIKTLVFIPDGVLRTVPISALNDGKQFLVEKIALATTVGLDLMDNRAGSDAKPKALLIGLSEDERDPLPNVVIELERIQALHGGDKLLNDDFTEQKVAEHLQNDAYSIVHIATHAQFSSKIEDSYLLASNGERLDISELEKHIAKTQISGKPIELLTLSACETAVGNDKAALGLAGVAIKAGARSVFASLWKIRDESTAALVEEFYRQIQGRKNNKASALRSAQLLLLKKPIGKENFDHPYYWAPFILLGNWEWG